MTKKAIIALLVMAFLLTMVLVPVNAAAPVTVKFTRWAGGDEAAGFQALADKFNKSQTAIKVETEFLPWGTYWQKLQTTAATGDAADIIAMSYGMAGDYLRLGAFYDLAQIPAAKKRLGEIQPGAAKGVTKGNSIFGMPVGLGVRTLLYSKPLFDAAKVKYPSATTPMTWAQFLDVCKKLTKKDASGKVIQYALNPNQGEFITMITNQAGGYYFDNPTNPTKITTDTPAYLAGMNYYKQLLPYIVPFDMQNSGQWGNPDNAIIPDGKCAMIITGPWSLGGIEDSKVRYGAAPVPMGKKRVNLGYINFWSVYKNSKHPVEAWKFIEWVTSKAGQMEFTKTGDLPALKAAANAAYNVTTRQDIMKSYYAELKFMQTGPMWPAPKMDAVYGELCTDVSLNRITPQEFCKQMKDRMQPLLDAKE